MRVAIVIGHTKKSKGALSKYFNLREWDFYNQVEKCVHNTKTFWHDENISGYTSRVKDTANRINKENFDLVIEMHFNSAVHESANGCETLYYYRSDKSKDYALKFSELVSNRTGVKVRNGGLKALTNRSDRGFASVYYTKAPTILIEPFFGSNESDCKKIGSAENLASIINEFVN